MSEAIEPSRTGLHPEDFQRPTRPTWVVVVAVGVAALVLGGAAGYLLHQPGPGDRTRVVTRTVEVTPRSCADALDSASAIADRSTRVGQLVSEAITAVQGLDFPRLQSLGEEALTLADTIRSEAARIGASALDCRSKARQP